MSEWTELKTMLEVAQAVERGDEIWCAPSAREPWEHWAGFYWNDEWVFRSRPKKKVKTIVLREALCNSSKDEYTIRWVTHETMVLGFVKWLDTPTREIGVEE